MKDEYTDFLTLGKKFLCPDTQCRSAVDQSQPFKLSKIYKCFVVAAMDAVVPSAEEDRSQYSKTKTYQIWVTECTARVAIQNKDLRGNATLS